MEALEKNPNADCVCFKCLTTIDGKNPVYSKYSIAYDYHQNGNQWFGKPAHTMIWKTAIAKKFAFPDKSYGEDIDWVKSAYREINREIQIDKVLYFYKFDSRISETRGPKKQDGLKPWEYGYKDEIKSEYNHYK